MSEPDDDQHWLDLMAGRAAPDADARTRKEAAWLRAAMLSYREAAPPGAPADADDRVARLLTKAREAGVLPTAPPNTSMDAANDASLSGKPASRWPRWPQALAAGVVLCAAVALLVPRQPDEEAGTLRGAPVQTVQAQDAAARRQQLLQDLRAAGFDAQPYERLGRPGIDVALPVPLPAERAAALKRLDLVPPPGPSLQIEFVTPTPAQ